MRNESRSGERIKIDAINIDDPHAAPCPGGAMLDKRGVNDNASAS
jgi:hypothetical protein